MLIKRLLSLTFNPKRYFPPIQRRFCTGSPFLDDSVDGFPSKGIKVPKITAIKSILKDHLSCDENEAQKIATEHKQKPLSEIRTQLETFLKNGIDTKIILKYPEIIGMSPTLVQEKLALLLDLPRGENGNGLSDYFPLLKLELEDLKKIKKKFKLEQNSMPYGSRIHFLSAKLLVEPHIVADMFSKYKYMFKVTDSQLLTNTELLLEYKFSSDQILRDPKGFCYSSTLIKERLDAAKKVIGNKDLKLWMIRCREYTFDRSMEIMLDKRAVLKEVGAEDELEYVSKRLGNESSRMENFLKSNPIRIQKLKQILDFLLDEAGYTPQQIIAVPHIFGYSLKRIQERHNELQALNYEVPMLNVYCLTAQNYEKLINKLTRAYFEEQQTKS